MEMKDSSQTIDIDVNMVMERKKGCCGGESLLLTLCGERAILRNNRGIKMKLLISEQGMNLGFFLKCIECNF